MAYPKWKGDASLVMWNEFRRWMMRIIELLESIETEVKLFNSKGSSKKEKDK